MRDTKSDTEKRGRPGRERGGWAVASGDVPSAIQLARMAREARCDGDEKIKKMIRAVHVTGNPYLARRAGEYLEARRLEQALNPDPFAPEIKAEEARGEVKLGVIKNSACVFGLWLTELCQHVLLTGRSGAGKTTLVLRMLKELLSLAMNTALSVKILVFDIKRDYGCLKALYPEMWLFRPATEDFRWNPLEPPIKNWRQWAGILASTLANSLGFFGGMGTENEIYKCLMEVYRKYDMDRDSYACLLDLWDYLELLKANKKIDRFSEEYKWFVRFRSRVESFCNAFGETVNCSRGYPLADILGHHTIFDLTGLKPDAQTFFTETFLTQALWHRIEHGERGGTLRTLAVFDEGKRLMPKYREESQHAISNMSHIIAMTREFGIGLVVAECDPRLLADSIKSSCYTRFCFSQTHGKDMKDSAESLALDREQAAEIQKLDTGQAIVRVAGRIKRPFALEVTP